MNKSTFILLFLLFISLAVFSQEKKYEDGSVKSVYQEAEGRFNGKYVSYYKDGQKKAEGIFENNLRSGKWTVWDSTGTIRMQRDYSDPYTFKRLIPEIPSDKPIQLLNIPRYKIEYNKEGFITNAYVKEAFVLYHKRIWRTLSPENNTILYENNRLLKLFHKHISDSTIKAYTPDNDEFTKEFMPESLNNSYDVIGFKIKEDFFFDMNRLVSETRIIGICPIVINNQTNDTINLYWVYYPEIRKYLAQEKVQKEDIPSKIKNLDDLFFYRYFYGEIYKESNIYDKRLTDFPNPKESERIEIKLIEKEHDIWISLTKSSGQ
jgi:Gliding motility associated protein GldN